MKIQVQVIYDTNFCTWNVVDMNKVCLEFGTIRKIEDWLKAYKKTHEEIE